MTRFYTTILACLMGFKALSQTLALDPAGAGGFEIGTTLASNGWVAVNSAFNQWVSGTGVVGFGTRSAYIGTSTSFIGSNTPTYNHFYRDFAIPATATNVRLKFKYFQPVTDPGWDSFYVSTTTTSTTPVVGMAAGTGYNKIFANTLTNYTVFTSIPSIDLSSFAGSTFRLVMTYCNDGASPIGLPAIDSVTLTYCDLAAISGTATVCPGGATTTLSHATTGGTWASSNTSIATIGLSSGTLTGVVPGTATITYTAGICTRTTVVTVNSLPIAENVTGGGGICASGGAGAHIGLDGSQAGVNYTLYNGATVMATVAGTGSSMDFGAFSATGTYTATATSTITTCSGNMAGSAVVSIATPVTPSVSITPDVTEMCSGATVSFTAAPVNGGTSPSYQWMVGSTPVGVGSSTYTYVPSAGDVVSVVLTPGGICTAPATATAAYTVAISPSLTPAVTINATPGNPSCLGKPVTFTATSLGGGSSPLYTWTRNSINVATGPAFTCTPANGDIFTCTITSNYNCRTADHATSTPITMVVQTGMPAPTVNIAAHPGTLITAGQLVSFTAAATGGTSSVAYLWHVNGVPVAGATSATFESNTLNNGDIVTCKTTNSDVCANSSLKSVTITVAGLGVNAAEAAHGSLRIVPNPNSGSFFVKGVLSNATDREVTLTIINTLGQVVYSALLPMNCGNIDQQLTIADMAPGIYTMSIRSSAENKSVYFNVTR